MSKSGFSTLNRWLGRKNKDKSMINGKLSKSSTNLSISSNNINETSQLEYNRITPLPAATTNAPFEQTFRITVLLPKDQLYVTRLGARVPLSKLLELVCDNKLLDAEKYEFRNPVDASQVYSCDLTIGAVGLSEVRLCHKSESYDNFNSDEIIKLHRTSLIRESLSSSEFSSRNSKHTTKTTSPYSSTNSLNSMDSTALSYGRSPKLPSTNQPKMSAPPRKKRAAPRPPSQIAIPEKSALIMNDNGDNKQQQQEQEQQAVTTPPMSNKEFSVSTTNLSGSSTLHSDINGNDCNGHLEDFNELSSGNGSLNSNGYPEDTVLYAQIQKKNALNLNGQSKPEAENGSKLPEPSPRKRIVPNKKKSTAPPAPPPRNSLYQEDAVSLASTNNSCSSTTTTPVDLCKSLDSYLDQEHQMPQTLERAIGETPKPVPRITTSTTLLNATDIENDLKNFESDTDVTKAKTNISKVLLNRTPTPEPRSLSCEPSDMEHSYATHLEQFKQTNRTEDDCISKQADSGIGEPVPSPTPTPTPDILPTSATTVDVKSNFESSSDDDDMVKVYNFKLGKTLVKPHKETKTLEELTVMNNGQEEERECEISTPLTVTQVHTPNTVTETSSSSSSWNFAIPISPPANFADTKLLTDVETDSKPDAPITPKIKERPVLDFAAIKREQEQQEVNKEQKEEEIATRTTLTQHQDIKRNTEDRATKTLLTPLDNIVDELSHIIQDKGVDSLIKKSPEPEEIEAAKPNTLSNFTINSIIQTNPIKTKEVLNVFENKPTLTVATQEVSTATDFNKSSSPLSSPSTPTDEEKLYRKRSSITSLKQRRAVTRSDSFHSTAGGGLNNETLGLTKRTSSQLSLDQMAGNLNRRRSSSELSIGESPSLMSLEVMKNILNSRKNSLANSSGEEDKPIEVNARRPSEELKFASLELKTNKSMENTQEQQNRQAVTKEKNNNNEKEIIKQQEKPKELPKVYRYSGPPSINFSTWSERPKSQVHIKNEGDYIFGGAQATTHNNNCRVATTVAINEPPPPPPVAPKPATIQRMGIPEKDYKVPIMVKPLQDVVIEQVPENQLNNKATIFKNTNQSQTTTPRAPGETLTRPAAAQVMVNLNNQTLPRPTVESVLRPQTQTIVNTSTLPRVNKQQRFSTPSNSQPTQPQILRCCSIKQTQETENVVNKPAAQILRSSSIKQQKESEKCKTDSNQQLAPFGQNTLRRTGFKEKILAQQEHEAKQQAINNTNTISSISLPQKFVANGDVKLQQNQKFNNSSITSAKLYLNLKKTNNSNYTTITNHTGSQTASPTSSVSFKTSALKPKTLTSPQTAPVTIMLNNILTKNSTTTTTTPPPPPPPAPASAPASALAFSLQLKPLTTTVKTPTESEDPRDELLSAIRNFNKQGLKKA